MGHASRFKKERKLKRARESWDQLLHPSYLAEIRQMILSSGATPDSCICCTKVLCQIGASLDLRVEPLTVETYIYNAAFVMHFANNGFDISTSDMVKIAERGGRYIVLGSRAKEDRKAKPGKWPGHLVAVVYPPKDVQEQPRVVDISLDQAHRPKKGIYLQEPVIFPVVKGFLAGTDEAIGLIEVGGAQMCMIYKGYPEVTDYEASPDWQRNYEARAHDKISLEELKDEEPKEKE